MQNQNQYLMVAENIIYKNNKLSCINIQDQFVAIQLPAEFTFDMVVICGPGWDVGEYELNIKAKTNIDVEAKEIGTIKVNIPSNNFIYNAIATDLKIGIGKEVNNISFFVYRNNEQIIERTYPINPILVQVPQPQEQEPEKSSV